MKTVETKQVQLVDLPKVVDERGNLTFLQFPKQVPFEIRRIFWIYGIPGGELRGGHAYRRQEELIIALSGSFDIVVTNVNGEKSRIALNRSYYGLYLPALTWRHIENYSTNALSLHLSSAEYSKQDYIYDFATFVKEKYAS